MLRKTDHCTEYKNGNISIRYDHDAIEKSKSDQLLTISEVLFEIDCNFIGETYCLSNYETGHTVYNAYSDLVYIFPWSTIDRLEAGKTVKLFGRKPDEDERETLTREGIL